MSVGVFIECTVLFHNLPCYIITIPSYSMKLQSYSMDLPSYLMKLPSYSMDLPSCLMKLSNCFMDLPSSFISLPCRMDHAILNVLLNMYVTLEVCNLGRGFPGEDKSRCCIFVMSWLSCLYTNDCVSYNYML